MDKYRYWSMLRGAYQDYHRAQEGTKIRLSMQVQEGTKIRLPMRQDFVSWMLEQWGIKVHTDPLGYTEYFDIADEHKYLLFELKYAGHKDTK